MEEKQSSVEISLSGTFSKYGKQFQEGISSF
jgi:hypothetical protein